MKNTIALSHPKLKPARHVDAIKHDVKKYIKRERNKPLPSGMDYWDFDCRYGATEADAEVIHVGEVNKHIDKAVAENLESFYLEVVARAGKRVPKPDQAVGDDEDFDEDDYDDFDADEFDDED